MEEIKNNINYLFKFFKEKRIIQDNQIINAIAQSVAKWDYCNNEFYHDCPTSPSMTFTLESSDELYGDYQRIEKGAISVEVWNYCIPDSCTAQIDKVHFNYSFITSHIKPLLSRYWFNVLENNFMKLKSLDTNNDLDYFFNH